MLNITSFKNGKMGFYTKMTMLFRILQEGLHCSF